MPSAVDAVGKERGPVVRRIRVPVNIAYLRNCAHGQAHKSSYCEGFYDTHDARGRTMEG